MAAPSVTARVIPVGYKLPDGFKTTIAFHVNPAIQLWEKTVEPPGYDGKEAIDTTTMLNTRWRTMAARQLITLAQHTFTFAYDPDFYNGILELINNQSSITVHLPDGSSISFWGFLQGVKFEQNEEGKMPLGTGTIVPTNWDPVNGVEAAPVFTPAGGT